MRDSTHVAMYLSYTNHSCKVPSMHPPVSTGSQPFCFRCKVEALHPNECGHALEGRYDMDPHEGPASNP